MDIFEAVVVEFGVVREERRQDVFDRIRALHGLGVVVLLVFCLILGGVSSGALHFTDDSAFGSVAEKVNGTIVAIVRKGSFGNYGRLRIY